MSSLKITAIDGRVFEGTTDNYAEVITRVTKYEEELKVKKEKAEAEAKIKEEKQKKLRQYSTYKLKEISDDLIKIKEKIIEYEKETGYKLIYTYGEDGLAIKEVVNKLDYAYDNILKDFINLFNTRYSR